MNRRSFVPSLLVLCASLLAAGALADDDAAPWGGEPFAAAPQRILAAAREIPVDPDHGVQVFLEEERFIVDETGRLDFRFRLVYRVDTESAIDSWSRVSRRWAGWYQERPTIEARVIAPDGGEHRLDPDDVGEYAEGEQGPDLYGEAMRLSGPLPAVEIGSVVEEVHHLRDSRAYFAPGRVAGSWLGQSVPVLHSRVIVDVPTSLPFRYKTYRLEQPDVEDVERDGRRRITVDVGPLKPFEPDAAHAPGDVARRPMVQFSTAASWNDVAAAYAATVDERIAEADVAAIVKKVTKKRMTPAQRIAALLRYVHDEVRYTGVEFGERSLVPADPETTLERRFGDCKDKSTLVVALLREAGFEAHVALLDTGPGFDVDPDLPGMGRFDHAIVRVGGGDPLWIDPTHPYAPAGVLPDGDQNRLALIASSSTAALTRTPRASPADNVRREERRAIFAADGLGTIVETSHVTGAFDLEYRSAFDKQSDAERREQLESYVTNHYLADSLGEVVITDPGDLTVPLELTLEATESQRIATSASQAVVYLNSPAVLSDLPDVLMPDDDDGADDDEGDRDRRRFPVELQRPYVAEHVYTIEPPPGYELSTVPDDETLALGPAELRRSSRRLDDGSIEVTLRFDTGKAVYTADEAHALTEGLREFYEDDNLPSVQFQEVGESHLAAGRIRDALDAFRALVERFPDAAIYRTKVARAYLAAGLGAEARREVERAVELEPDSMTAHRTRGVILAHDLLGRKFYPGMDHAGAEQAFRRALELDPDDFEARGELSILLEHAPDGRRYADGARMDEALQELRYIREELDNESLVQNELTTLFRSERYAEAVELWESLAGQNADRGAVLLAAIAARDGVEPALRKASELTHGAAVYRSMLLEAGNLLAQERLYARAAAVIEASAKGADDSVARMSRANVLRRFRRHDSQPSSLDGPDGVAVAFMLRAMEAVSTGAGFGPVRELLCDEAAESLDRERPEELEAAFDLRGSGLDAEQARDAVFSLIQTSVEGDAETGHAVRMAMTGQPNLMVVYTLVRDGSPCVIGGTGGLDPLGEWLLSELDAGRLELVRTWLDRLADHTYDREAPLENRHPLEWLWPGGEADVETARVASAALLADEHNAERIESILVPAREAADSDDARMGIDLALLRHAMATDDRERIVEVTGRLLEAEPREFGLLTLRLMALMKLERFEQAASEIDRRLERRSRDPLLLNAKTDLLMNSGQFDTFRTVCRELIDSGTAQAPIYNNLAWVDIAQGRVDDDTVRTAEQGVSLTNYSSAASLHTLATAYAELGRVSDARDTLIALLELRPKPDLEHHDWYILGRIAEHFGVEHAALDAYSRVEPSDDEGPDDPLSTYVLAQRRIRAIRAE